MGYLHIENLAKNKKILYFKECYALEKIEGTSAHISFNNGKLGFYSGGASLPLFESLFDKEFLQTKLTQMFGLESKVFIYGEAYGGKIQKMSETYGPNLKFVVFDFHISGKWLAVPKAEEFAKMLGLEFVAYELIPAEIEAINRERDRPSRQAARNGIMTEPMAEGVVLRPLIEITVNNDERLICKHKRPEFSERLSKKDTNLTEDKAKALETAKEIAEEWVTAERTKHVVSRVEAEIGQEVGPENTKKVIDTMVEDVYREGSGEVVETKDTTKAIGALSAKMFRQFMNDRIDNLTNL